MRWVARFVGRWVVDGQLRGDEYPWVTVDAPISRDLAAVQIARKLLHTYHLEDQAINVECRMVAYHEHSTKPGLSATVKLAKRHYMEDAKVTYNGKSYRRTMPTMLEHKHHGEKNR